MPLQVISFNISRPKQINYLSVHVCIDNDFLKSEVLEFIDFMFEIVLFKYFLFK